MRGHGSMSTAAAVRAPEALSAVWTAAWSQLVARIGAHFPRSEARAHAAAYLRGLLSTVERKNGWQLAEAVGDATPYALQHLLSRAVWDADAARDDLRTYVVEHLGDPRGVLVVDETGFLKKGTHSVGVQRQYSGTAGRVENCQVGVFLAYATPRGRTFLDRALYLPASWTDDAARCARAGVPRDTTFATKPALARAMLDRALDAGVPAAWVTGDEVYGNDRQLCGALEERRQPYVLAVTCQRRVFYDGARREVREIAPRLPSRMWHRLSAGAGTKGPRRYDWAYLRFGRAAAPRGFQRGLLFRRAVHDRRDVAYYTVLARAGATLPDLVAVAGARWAIEEGFESAKGEVGLDQYEVRNWPGWHRHITLALWAHAFLTVQRAAALPPPGEKTWTAA